MKSSDLAELRKKNSDDLHKMLAEHRSELMNLRFSHSTGALENPARLSQTRRDIARILTVLKQEDKATA